LDNCAGVINNVEDEEADVVEHTEDTISNFINEPIMAVIIGVSTIISSIILPLFRSCASRTHTKSIKINYYDKNKY